MGFHLKKKLLACIKATLDITFLENVSLPSSKYKVLITLRGFFFLDLKYKSSDLNFLTLLKYFRLDNKELLLLGEREKWIPMSYKRFRSITFPGDDCVITLTGAPGETVQFHYIYDMLYVKLTCKLSQAGLGTISVVNQSC